MRVRLIFRFSILLNFLLPLNPASGQHIGIDTAAIKSLVHEWNFANNTRSMESFYNVYGDRLLFYTQELTENNAVALKQKMFENKPGFRQNIASGITYTPYTSGVIKCDFTKEVWETSRWRKYASYLLISYHGSRYQIVGESDYPTDKTLRYQLALGEPMQFQPLPATQDTHHEASSAANRSFQQERDTLAEIFSRSFESILSALPPGMMVVPKRHVYLFMALLLAGGLAIFFADIIYARRKRRRRVKIVRRRDEADDMIAALNTQSVFESFVVTLFDPVLFRHRRPEAERVYAGNMPEGQSGPDLEFVYHNKDTTGRFAVKCLYFANASERRLQLLRDVEAGIEMDLYYVLGIGGTPDDPKELYLLPARSVKGASITRDALRPFAKSGMFYFHRKVGQLR